MKTLLYKFVSWLMALLNKAYDQERDYLTQEENQEWLEERRKVYKAMREHKE